MVHLEVCLKTSDSVGYAQILSRKFLAKGRKMFESNRFIKVQDNAPYHYSRKTIEIIKNKELEFVNLSPNSPGMNPVENIRCVLAPCVYNDERKLFRKEES